MAITKSHGSYGYADHKSQATIAIALFLSVSLISKYTLGIFCMQKSTVYAKEHISNDARYFSESIYFMV